MSTALFTELSSYFNMDPDDPAYRKELIRPAEIKEDVKLMEQRQRVTKIMKSKLFKKELENVFKSYQLDEEFEGDPTSILSLADISEQLLLSAIPKNKVASYSHLINRKGVICINDLPLTTVSPYNRIESQFRCRLAAVFRLLDMYAWNSGFDATLTARPLKDREQFLVNPFGLLFHEVTASSFITLDFKGNILDYGSTVLEANSTAWMIHAVLYSCKPDIRSILQLKTPAAVAISSLEYGLLPVSREAIILGDSIILSELPSFEDDTRTTSLLLADVKNYISSVVPSKSKILILPNNGILICGDSVEEAWHYLANCQIACETQLKLGNLSFDDLVLPEKSTRTELFNEWRATDLGGISEFKENNIETGESQSKWRLGELEFEALMRHLDNNGYRTGYFYRQENIFNINYSQKSNKNKFDVEIPPSSSLFANQKEEKREDDTKQNRSPMKSKSGKWFNTPNQYKLVDDNGEADNLSLTLGSYHSDRKSAKWISTKYPSHSAPIPQRPVTAGAYVTLGSDAYKQITNETKFQPHINPKEIIENQKKVKNKYYHDTNTAGPISCLLDSGLSREEAMRLKSETLRKQLGPSALPSDEIVTSASKGIIQRGHKAVVYQDLYKPANPFEKVTAEDLDKYQQEVDRKLNPHLYESQPSSIKEEAPEIQITPSQSEVAYRHPTTEDDEFMHKRETEFEASYPKTDNQIQTEVDDSITSKFRQCHSFFQTSDLDDDFLNFKLVDTVASSDIKHPESVNVETRPNELIMSTSDSTTVGIIGELTRSTSIKETKIKKSAEPQATKSATLAAPGYGTITSETSGADVSHDEVDQDAKGKKKKRKFKFPFSKKKKDKSLKGQ